MPNPPTPAILITVDKRGLIFSAKYNNPVLNPINEDVQPNPHDVDEMPNPPTPAILITVDKRGLIFSV
jgi:hypothetical protein